MGTKVMSYIRAHMTNGHFLADLDPLKLQEQYAEIGSQFNTAKDNHKDLLNISTYGFSQEDLDKSFYIDLPLWGGMLAKKKVWTLRELRDSLENAYCGKIGVEYMHIPDREQCNYIRKKIEMRQYDDMTPREREIILDRILMTDEFSNFIGTKFNTMKRFGLEGCESLIPGLKAAMTTLKNNGAEKVVIGMPHRGRLSLLANVINKPLEVIFAEFQGVVPLQGEEGNEFASHSGDVKYHLGTSYTKTFKDGKKLTVEVLANPSHLECVNPVVMGRVRAENHILNTQGEDTERDKLVPILIHGDASFAGQGVVYEAMQMQDLKNYTVGGTLHVICNNQIGFTTVPQKARSGNYASDLAKAINAPIFHVNANSMEDVTFVFQTAAKYRQKFNHDVVIDLIGYRKFGHNELDQPSFTQPIMYKSVSQMQPVARIYENFLIENGHITAEKVAEMKQAQSAYLEEKYVLSKGHKYQAEDWKTEEWEKIIKTDKASASKTGIEVQKLRDIGIKISTLPEGENFHRLVKKIFEQRVHSIKKGEGIDWGTAEAMAFATLIEDGFHVRISGQDVERGTFSHRHAHVFY